MQILPTGPERSEHHANDRIRVGDRVRVRQQRWLIADVRAYDDCAAVTLTGLGPSNRGDRQQVLTPFDLVEPLTRKRSFRIVRRVRWRHACRHLIAGSGPAGILRTAVRARMEVLPYQLEPALAIVQGKAARILIADEVGLGKTVQTALILAELQSRGAVSRALVLTPAGLRDQWIHELASRFDLRPVLFDIAHLARRRASLPVGVNPWSVDSVIVTSMDYVKRPEVAPLVQCCRWDLVIVDEAHHAVVGTDRHDAIAAVCRTAPYVVLLTATPHSGDPRAFASLCEVGRHRDRLLVFRRMRRQVGRVHGRRVHQLRVRPNAAERAMHATLDTFVRAVQREPHGRDQSTWLALSTLQKRALSSGFALQRSVERRLIALGPTHEHGAGQLTLPLDDVGGEFEADDDVPPWAIPALRDPERERTLLMRVAAAAAATAGRESKLSALRRLLRRIRQPAVVFTEYRDTLLHVRAHVAPAATVLHGGLSRHERRIALEHFRDGGVMLATDAAGEGLNLHHTCRIVVNLELPWNPTRLEQRIGRVDRLGQTQTVHAFHFVAEGTTEVRILRRLEERIARARTDIETANPLQASGLRQAETSATTATEGDPREAAEEHQRLMLARVLAAPPEDHPSVQDIDRHSLVTHSRRWRTRRHLPSRALILVRSVLCNDAGQAVAWHVTPLTVALNGDAVPPLRSFEALTALVHRDHAYATWVTSSLAVHEAFWTTRAERERAIAAAHERPGGEIQPGLFDQRTERALNEADEQRRGLVSELNRHIGMAARSKELTLEPPHVALVLLTT